MTLWEKGQSANPAGRPKGIIDKRVQFRALFEECAPDVIAKTIELAKAGDMDAIKLVLERVAPRQRDEQHRRPLAIEGNTIEAAGQSILAGIAAGELSPDEGASLLTGLARQGELQRLGVLMDVVAELVLAAGKPLPPELRLRRPAATIESEPKDAA